MTEKTYRTEKDIEPSTGQMVQSEIKSMFDELKFKPKESYSYHPFKIMKIQISQKQKTPEEMEREREIEEVCRKYNL